MKNILVKVLILSFFASAVFAGKMNMNANSVVINKLEKALALTKDGTIKSNSILKRLGDLYSERARLHFMREIEKGQKNTQSTADRKQALNYYNKAYKFIRGKEKLPLILQISHLNQMLGRTGRAKSELYLLHKLAKRYRDKSYQGLALYGLGEIAFSSGHYKTALFQFKRSIKIVPASLRPMNYYRMAWSYVNTGGLTKAINTMVKILRTTELLEKDGKYNQPFHEDVSRDLVTFLARKKISEKDINFVVSLSPDSRKDQNVYSLGIETERTAQWRSNILVWNHYLGLSTISKTKKLEVNLRMAQVFYFMNKKSKSLSSYNKALELWDDGKCRGDECINIKPRFKNYIVHWQKDIRKRKDPYFVTAIDMYLNVFDEDGSVYYIAAVHNNKNKKYKRAVELYLIAAKKAKKDQAKMKSAALIEMVQAAEKSRNNKVKRKAYVDFLAMSSNVRKKHEVKYQLIYLSYQEKDFKTASDEFYKFAQNNSVTKSLRQKSADLALDSLVTTNKTEVIQNRANHLAVIIPGRKREFLNISRTACFNESVLRLSNKSTSDSTLKKSLNCLKKHSFSDLPAKVEIKYRKVQIALAFKLKEFNEVVRVSRLLSSHRKVTLADKDFALGKLLFVHELQLKFYSAYKVFKKITNHKMSKADRELKLGMLAELANIPSSKHYNKFIKFTPSTSKANAIRVHLALQSRKPWKNLISLERKLMATPSLFAGAGVEAFGRYKNINKAKYFISKRSVLNTDMGMVLAREVQLYEMESLVKKFKRHKISSMNQYILTKGLQRRIKLLDEGEYLLKRSTGINDPLFQAHLVSFLGYQYERFVNEVEKLPVPRGLSSQQLKAYEKNLQAKMTPFKKRYEALLDRANEIWGSTNMISKSLNLFKQGTQKQRKVIAIQLKKVTQYAPGSQRRKVSSKVDSSSPYKNKSISTVWSKIKQDPFNVKMVKEMQGQMNYYNKSTVHSYLDLRLIQIKRIDK